MSYVKVKVSAVMNEKMIDDKSNPSAQEWTGNKTVINEYERTSGRSDGIVVIEKAKERHFFFFWGGVSG